MRFSNTITSLVHPPLCTNQGGRCGVRSQDNSDRDKSWQGIFCQSYQGLLRSVYASTQCALDPTKRVFAICEESLRGPRMII